MRHDGGVVVDSPGWSVLGLPVLRRRKSSFIYGAEDDARELVDHLAGHLDVQASGSQVSRPVGAKCRRVAVSGVLAFSTPTSLKGT